MDNLYNNSNDASELKEYIENTDNVEGFVQGGSDNKAELSQFELKTRDLETKLGEYLSKNKDKLLGDYDSDDIYTIADEIRRQLIGIKKVKKSTFKNSVFCVSDHENFKDLVFEIVYEKNSSQGIAMASLYLLESVSKVNGYLQNTIKSLINVYQEKLDDFIQKSYDAYNIVVDLDDQIGGKEYKEQDDSTSYIRAKTQFNLLMDEYTSQDYQSLYKDLFNQRITYINEHPCEMASDILSRFKSEFQLIEKFFLKDRDYKSLCELLDKCFEELDLSDEKKREQLRLYKIAMIPVINQMFIKAQNIQTQVKPNVFNQMKKADVEKVKEVEQQVQPQQPKNMSDLAKQVVQNIEQKVDNTNHNVFENNANKNISNPNSQNPPVTDKENKVVKNSMLSEKNGESFFNNETNHSNQAIFGDKLNSKNEISKTYNKNGEGIYHYEDLFKGINEINGTPPLNKNEISNSNLESRNVETDSLIAGPTQPM